MKTYLQEKRERFSREQLVFQLVTKAIPQEIEQLPFILQDRYVIKGSVGQGVWTNVPWIDIMNKEVTTSTQRRYYIVYLFSDDMSKLYLAFAQGVTETPKEEITTSRLWNIGLYDDDVKHIKRSERTP
jgi:5-methylcytosine-specific restriction enzyme B